MLAVKGSSLAHLKQHLGVERSQTGTDRFSHGASVSRDSGGGFPRMLLNRSLCAFVFPTG